MERHMFKIAGVEVATEHPGGLRTPVDERPLLFRPIHDLLLHRKLLLQAFRAQTCSHHVQQSGADGASDSPTRRYGSVPGEACA